MGFVGQENEGEEEVNQAQLQEQQPPPATNQSASSRMGRNSRRQLAVTTLSKHRIGAAQRLVMPVHSQFVESHDYNGCYRTEIDSRADTVCCGKGWIVDSFTGVQADVGGFHDSMDTVKNVPVASCLTAFDHPDGHTFILMAHEALFFGETMEHSLIPPAQVWNNHLICDIVPKHCSNGKSLFGIYDHKTNVHLPFSLYGCIAYLPTRLPTEHELDNCDRIYLTSDEPWDPYSKTFADRERPFLPTNLAYQSLL